MTPPIAIVGMACEYPDARSPAELWENVLARRRAFRRLPPERLRIEDYLSADRGAPDCTYSTEAALIEGYEFDRVGFRVAGPTFRAADPAHWLALDVAARALADAGFGGGEGLPREATGVFLGNTLTGEFSRADVLRLRWPYVRRMLEAALADEDWSPGRRREFLDGLEARYKAPFPPVGEETLAGGLSNTIAGRICNHFDLNGGGYTVDGACASSLLATAHACQALVAGDLDVALTGGVDLSLDPFELVGFAKSGALAGDEMRVFDAGSAGFWPGEGCGVVVLMRLDDARERGLRVDAVIRGWGVSSDGQGGMTRPEVAGQLLALRRAYRRAGFDIGTVAYFEGHGTGTAVGDATELRALSRARRESAPDAPAAAIGSIKALIGHTKAAAGAAGLIKAVLALRGQVLPPTAGCHEPHPELVGERPALRVLDEGEPWPADRPLRAGVSAMGFGGVNAHVVLEGQAAERRASLGPRERGLLASAQDAELFLISARDTDDLRSRVERLGAIAGRLSRAEVADLSARLVGELGQGQVRAALVASRPSDLVGRLETLRSWLADGVAARLDPRAGIFLGSGDASPRIGFLFPGQGSPAVRDGGALRRRFQAVRELYEAADLPPVGDGPAAAGVQPAIVAASLAALRVLDRLGIEARVAVGHSLGELTAYGWAGALDEGALRRIAVARGRAMTEDVESRGAMASIAAGAAEVTELINGELVVVAGLNAPRQTVISGAWDEVDRVMARARSRGLPATRLPVAQAFHSPLVAPAVPALAGALAREEVRGARRAVYSTVTGARLGPEDDLRELLCRQVTSPVRFAGALAAASIGVDLWIEVGPGRVLAGLASESLTAPVVAVDAAGASLVGLWSAVGAAFALGAPVTVEALDAERFTRPFDPDRRLRFFENPCERAPLPESAPPPDRGKPHEGNGTPYAAEPPRRPQAATALDLVRGLVAERAELPPSAVGADSRLLNDLHLNSITVGQLVAEASRSLGLPPPATPTDFANATVAEIARALEEHVGDSEMTDNDRPVPGIESWVRPFTIELVERPQPPRPTPGMPGPWRVIAPPGHPLAEPLSRALAESGIARGVVVCLPSAPDERHVELLLSGARALASEGDAGRLVLVQHGGGGSAFARSLHLEYPESTACVVDLPFDHPMAADWVVAEAAAASGYAEAHYDAQGRRREPVLRVLDGADGRRPDLPLGPADVLLVTGGGKGIAAECALDLAKATGVRLALMGRSLPPDAELQGNLGRFQAQGVRFRYISADVAVAGEVRDAIRAIEADLGPITAIVHGAGVNVPRRLDDLDEAEFQRTLAPKVLGARNLLAAIRPEGLKLFVSFGSIIARTGMRGEAHYAVANEWLARVTDQFQRQHPACRCLAVEWSIWSGVGMGERLGRVDALARQGIMPIPPEQGVRVLRELLSGPLPSTSVVVTARLGAGPTLALAGTDLPRLRFLEHPRVHYPGVELVVDATLSAESDPYLDDHVYRGERLFPAALGLEAMAQAAMAAVGSSEPPIFEEVGFDRPVWLPKVGTSAIRLAVLVRGPGRAEVVLRSEGTAFQVDHFRATCRFEDREPMAAGGIDLEAGGPRVSLDPSRDLYDGVLFQRGRFRRLSGYRRLQAEECLAEIVVGGQDGWFADTLPGDLVLGDPGARDATIHAVQACIPHETVLPIGVDRLTIASEPVPGPWLVSASERSHEGDLFVYDLEVVGADGSVRERWEGLRLQVVKGATSRGPWAGPLLGPYLERQVRPLIPGSGLSIAVEQGATPDRRDRSDRAIRRALGRAALIERGADGKPRVADGPEVSAAHARDLTLAVAGPGPLGCDVEAVASRPESVWADLLGPDRHALAVAIARESGEDFHTAATRLWGAGECLKKAGIASNTPLVLTAAGADGRVVLTAGPLVVVTLAATIRGDASPHVFAVAAREAGRSYEYRHIVSFEETNLVGNVYYVNHLRWQGRCRELFLRDHAPGVLEQLGQGLSLVTTRCSCEYLAELCAFDEVSIRMRLGALAHNRVSLLFEYWRRAGADEELIARGTQEFASMRRDGRRLTAAPLPEELHAALRSFSGR